MTSGNREAALAAVREPTAGMREAEALRRRLLRLALDIHDGPMQELVAAAYALAALQTELGQAVGDDASGRITAGFARVAARLAATERSLRALIVAEAEQPRTLLEAVEAVVAAFAEGQAAQIELRVDRAVDVATASQRITIERVVRESLVNAIKHGRADRIVVQLRGIGDSLLLQIRDNGRGFDPDATRQQAGGGIGLCGMAERLRLLGGTLAIESRPGGPTVLTATIEKWRPQKAA